MNETADYFNAERVLAMGRLAGRMGLGELPCKVKGSGFRFVAVGISNFLPALDP